MTLIPNDNEDGLPPSWEDLDNAPIYETILELDENDIGWTVRVAASVSNDDLVTYGIVNGRTRAENSNDAFIERQVGNFMEISVSGNEKFASEEVSEYSLRLRASVS